MMRAFRGVRPPEGRALTRTGRRACGFGARLLTGLLVTVVAGLPVVGHSQTFTYESIDYQSVPPFLPQQVEPNVIISLDTSGSMKVNAFAGGFDPNRGYFGYFETGERYRYDTGNEWFIKDASGAWDGDFLNWLAMRRIDVTRKVLVGGRVPNRASPGSFYVIEGQSEPEDSVYTRSFNDGDTVTPFDDNTQFKMLENGRFEVVGDVNDEVRLTSGTSGRTPITNELEIGYISTTRTVTGAWESVSFANSYTNPVVVAVGLSNNGGDPTVVRVRNVNALGFELAMQEWDYLDGGHTDEVVFYMVAERGTHTIPLVVPPGPPGSSLRVQAGVEPNPASWNCDTSSGATSVNLTGFSQPPTVFTGVSSYNDPVAVTARNLNVSAGGFETTLVREEQYCFTSNFNHGNDDIHWIAVERTGPGPVRLVDRSGLLPVPGLQMPIQVGVTDDVVTNDLQPYITLNGMTALPYVAHDMQTLDGRDSSALRFDDDAWSQNSFEVFVEEEESRDDEVGHTDEVVGFLAVADVGGTFTQNSSQTVTEFRVRVAIPASEGEPIGLLQELDPQMRLGMAVFNYDHADTTPWRFQENDLHGGTLFPTFLEPEPPVGTGTPGDSTPNDNFDIALELHNKVPLDNLIKVTEDHPMVWKTTPIAETLINIGQYAAQEQFDLDGDGTPDTGGLNARPWPDSADEQGLRVGGTDYRSTYPLYEVNDDWDPYFYNEYDPDPSSGPDGSLMECAETYVLHFNDGAPFKDWDSAYPDPTGITINDGTGSFGENEALDDVALRLREADLRADLAGHQSITSFYVLAALGSSEVDLDQTGLRRLREAAINGGFEDADGDNQPDPPHPSNINNYISSNGGNCTGMENEWDQDGDCNPDAFYLASNGFELIDDLREVFTEILDRASSGSAASVISSTATGAGAAYQALFFRSRTLGQTVNWIGRMHALLIDSSGRLREDANGNQTLDDLATDPILDFCADDTTVRVKRSTSDGARPSETEKDACAAGVFNATLEDVNYLWDGADWLMDVSDSDITGQRGYSSTDDQRRIYTSLDGSSLVDFMPSTFDATNSGVLRAADATEAAAIVNWVRGLDQAGLRSRKVTMGGSDKTWRLADIIYSSPRAVDQPRENFDRLYLNLPIGQSYRNFASEYRNRRTMVYVGSNGGMLHAFNGGTYDPATNKFEKGSPAWDLGAEVWSYIPKNVLSHLKRLADVNYGESPNDHLYTVDLEPRIFDAQIFADDTVHPDGWGTVLVGGMRFGGGRMDIDVDNDGTIDSGATQQSAYFALDITDPNREPELLFEFSHDELGFTMGDPTPVLVDGAWYLIFGSGAYESGPRPGALDEITSNQTPKLFVVCLSNCAGGHSMGDVVQKIDVGGTNGFVTDIISVDYNLDASADILYFGTVTGSPSSWGGKLHRIPIFDGSTSTYIEPDAPWVVKPMVDAGAAVTSSPNITVDPNGDLWVYFGTGRYYTVDDTEQTSHYFYGIRERGPGNAPSDTAWDEVPATAIVDTTGIEVADADGALSATLSIPDSPAVTAGNFTELRDAMLNPTDPTLVQGWKRELKPTGARNLSMAAILANTVTYTSFRPDNTRTACDPQGKSYISAVHFLTGTAAGDTEDAVFGVQGGNRVVTRELGDAVASEPSLHVGRDYLDDTVKAFVQTSAGEVLDILQEGQEGSRSGVRDWRQGTGDPDFQ